MLCPNCHAECIADDVYCRHCGTDLTLPSKGLIPAQRTLPAILHSPQLPRLVAGIGALAVGFGLELLRRSLLARLARAPHSATSYLPASTFDTLRDVFAPQDDKPVKLPKGYEIEETAFYFRRVIRREA